MKVLALSALSLIVAVVGCHEDSSMFQPDSTFQPDALAVAQSSDVGGVDAGAVTYGWQWHAQPAVVNGEPVVIVSIYREGGVIHWMSLSPEAARAMSAGILWSLDIAVDAGRADARSE